MSQCYHLCPSQKHEPGRKMGAMTIRWTLRISEQGPLAFSCVTRNIVLVAINF